MCIVMCRSSAPDPAARIAPVRGAWQRQDGLTLVELLTSLMVAAIIMVALLQSLTSASDSWTRQSKHFSSQREGRVAIRILVDDLAALVTVPEWARAAAPTGGTAPSGDETEPPPDNRTGFLLESAASDQDSARLAFLRATGTDERDDDHARGDLRLVMYGLALTSDGGASGLAPNASSQKLVRRVLSAAETFRRLQLHLETGSPLVVASDWTALETLQDEPGVAEVGVVAHDVIRFDAKPFADLLAPNLVPADAGWQPANWLDLTLRVTNRQTGQHLQTRNDWRGAGAREQELHNGTREDYHDDPEVRTYSTRLRLSSATL